MIQCDICYAWHHVECVGLQVPQVQDIGKYHCPRCEPMCGPSTMKAEGGGGGAGAGGRKRRRRRAPPVAPADDELSLQQQKAADDVVCSVPSDRFDDDTLDRDGFSRPIFLSQAEGKPTGSY